MSNGCRFIQTWQWFDRQNGLQVERPDQPWIVRHDGGVVDFRRDPTVISYGTRVQAERLKVRP